MNSKRFLIALTAALLCLLSQAPASLAAQRTIKRAALPVPGEYIVVLADSVAATDVPAVAKELAARHGGELQKVWQYAVKGFFVKMPEARAAKMLRDRRVRYVEENAATFPSASQVTDLDPVTGAPTTDNRMWHLDRLDENPADHRYNYCSTGNGVTVYVIDGGVMRSHSEFIAANVKDGYNAAEPDEDKARYPAYDPCHGWPVFEAADSPDHKNYVGAVLGAGHGTSVASLVAGQHTGSAKNAIIVPVKVSRCDLDTARRWMPNHDYQDVGALVTIEAVYWKCVTGGRSGNTPPSNTTPILSTVTDGTVTWQKLGFNNPSDNVRHWAHRSYNTKEYVINARGHVWKSTQAGTTGATEPVWPNTLTSITDGTVTWQNQGPQLVPQTTQMKIDGINWILSPANPNIVNHSIATLSTYVIRGDPMMTGSLSFDEAILALIDAGVTVFASANNQDDDACNTSPGHLSRNNPDPNRTSRWKVITVGGSMLSPDPDFEPGQPHDARWLCGPGDSSACSSPIDTSDPSWNWSSNRGLYAGTLRGSNKGQCVTLFAPAKNVTSARMSGPNDYRDRLGAPDAQPLAALASGTSFSAPIAAGVAARFLEHNPAASVDDVYNALMNSARLGVLDPNGLESDNVMLRATDVWIYRQPEPTTVAMGDTALLVAYASGPGTLTYQWYRGETGDTSELVGSTWALEITPEETSSYWVRISSNCRMGATIDSTAAVVTVEPSFTAPTDLVATTVTGNDASVTVSWSAVSGAAQYQLQRSTYAYGTYVNAGAPVAGTSKVDAPPAQATPITYVYRVVVSDAFGNPLGAFSNFDYATVATPRLFRDDPIGANQLVAVNHMADLRAAVDAVRVAAGANPAAWSQPLSLITVASMNEIRTNLDFARNAMQIVAYPYSQAITSGGLIRKLHIEEMRAGVR